MSYFIKHLKGLAKLQNNTGLKVGIETAADLIEQLQQRVGELEKERDALSAHVEDYRNLTCKMQNNESVEYKFYELLRKSPQTSLAEVRARAIEDAITSADNWRNDGHPTSYELEDYANKIRNGKDGE